MIHKILNDVTHIASEDEYIKAVEFMLTYEIDADHRLGEQLCFCEIMLDRLEVFSETMTKFSSALYYVYKKESFNREITELGFETE